MRLRFDIRAISVMSKTQLVRIEGAREVLFLQIKILTKKNQHKHCCVFYI